VGEGAKRVRVTLGNYLRMGGRIGIGGVGVAEGAAGGALAEGITGGGAGATGTGRVAHQMPAARKSATPSTGIHIGVCGSSSSCVGWLSMALFEGRLCL
jgi:hypothetical protein